MQHNPVPSKRVMQAKIQTIKNSAMKKIFTLLTLAAMAVFGAQAELVDASKVTFGGVNPAYQQALTQKMSRETLESMAVSNPAKVQKRVWTNGSFTWEVYLQNMGPLTTILALTGEDGNLLNHEQVPFNCVRMLLYRSRQADMANPDTEIDCLCSWPTYRTWKDTDLSPELSTKIVSLDDFVNTEGTVKTFQWNNFSNPSSNLYPSINSNGEITSFPIWSNIMDDIKSIYNGQQNLTLTSAGTRVSRFTLESYDPDAKDTILMPFDFYFSNNTSCSGRYNGPALIFDFDIEERPLDLTHLHIFNCGPQGSNYFPNLYELPFDYPTLGEASTWGPVQKFYLYGLSKNADLIINSQNNEVPFESSLLKIDWSGEIDDVDFIHGALYSEFGTEKPYEQRWTMSEPLEYYDAESNMTIYLMQPEPNTMVPNGYDTVLYPWSDEDGAYVCYKGYGRTVLGLWTSNGTPDGFILGGSDLTENTYSCQPFTGKIIYHYDAKNMRLTEDLDSVGTLPTDSVNEILAEENVKVIAANGAINIVAENDANVAIYTLDGAIVNGGVVKAGDTYTFNGSNGLYLVKVGKTTCKVVL